MDIIASKDNLKKLKTLSDEQAKANEATNVASATTCAEEENNGPDIENPDGNNEQEIENPDGNEVKNDDVISVSKKGISITRSLVLFGYESWAALEPCKFKSQHISK